MNKLFTSIAVASLSLTMAVGVGVAVNQSAKKAQKVDAAVEYTLVTSNSSLSNNDTVVILMTNSNPTVGTTTGVTGQSGSDATVGTSGWAQYVVGSASSSGWTLYDTSANKYIASPNGNKYIYGTSGGTCSVNANGVLTCNSRYLCKNSSYYRMYTSIGSYSPFYVWKVTDTSSSSIMTFDFEESTAHRTSGNNSYTSNTYTENNSTISLTYADSVTTGSPISGSANILARIAKNTTNSPVVLIGPISSLSSYEITKVSYKQISVSTMTTTSSYSTDGTNWTTIETHTGAGSSAATYGSANSFSVVDPTDFYIKITTTVASSTTSNRDFQIDDINIIGASTSTSDLDSITCSNQTIDVASSVDLKAAIVYDPADAANKDVTFDVKSGNQYIDLNTSTGVVTGKTHGSAVVTITPDDTHADPIDVTITVNAISAPGITVGNQYVIYALSEQYGNHELTGLSTEYATVTEFTGSVPSSSFVFDTVAGYYENTVAFKNGSNYLSLGSNANQLNHTTSVAAESSWIVTWNSSTEAATITNAVYQTRQIKFNGTANPKRFATYASGQVDILLHEFENNPLVDFTIESEIDVYKTGKKTIAVTYNPADASDKTLTWTSNDTSVATVSNGEVTGVAVGQTTVTASKLIGSSTVTRTCTVNVVNNASTHRGTLADPFNVSDAVNVALGVLVEDPDGTPIALTNTYFVRGIHTKNVNRSINTSDASKSDLTFWIGDDASQVSTATGGFEVYKASKVYGSSLNDAYENTTALQKDFNVGNYVTVKSTFTEYNGTPETTSGAADIVFNNHIEAVNYAKAFNSALGTGNGICTDDNTTDTTALSTEWGNQSTAYSALDPTTKALFEEATANKGGNDIQQCAAQYDWIVGRYELTNFMGRNVQSQGLVMNSLFAFASEESTIAIIVVVALSSVTAIGAIFFIKRRKYN